MERMICMENINVDKVFQDYGLEVQQVEPYVYKVLNTEKEISVEELQDSLVSSILITSDQTGYKKLNIGGYYTLAYIYYIILDKKNEELGYKYNNKANEEFGESIYDSYEYDSKGEYTIDTIYAKGEV
jgi:hypothetical protein